MQAIILAAGRGERLMPLTATVPKVLLPLWDGETILQKQLKTFGEIEEIERVVVVTGYLTEKVEEKIDEWGYSDLVEIAYNPFYRVSNNLISVWFGANKTDGDTIITNGDNLFRAEVIEKLTAAGDDGRFLIVDKKEEYDMDDMKVRLESNNIVEVSKKIDPKLADAESTGIALFSGSGKKDLMETLEYLVRKEEYLNRFWLEVFNTMAAHGKTIAPVWIDEREWQEMDIHSDKALIDHLLKNRNF